MKTSKHYKWYVVGMLWFVCFLNYADRQAISAVFPALREEFGFDSVQIGLIGSAFMWVYAFGAPFAGLIADRCPRKHLILGGCLFWSFVTVMTGWCNKFWHFVTVRALEGVGETFYFPSSMSLVSDYHGKRTRSRAFSIHQTSVYAGTILGSWIGAWFAETHGWRWGFYLFGGAGIILAIVLYRFLHEPVRGAAERGEDSVDANDDVPSDNDGPDPSLDHGIASGTVQPLGVSETLRVIFGKRTAILLMGAFLGANFVATIFLMWTPTFLHDKFGFRLSAAGLSGAVFIHLASACSAPLGGYLADRLSRRFFGGRMLTQAVGLVMGAGFVVMVGLTGDTATLIFSMTAFGLCKGLYDANIFASLYDVIEPRARATAAGIMNTVGWGGGALGPVTIGLIAKYGRHVPADASDAARQAAEVANMSEGIAMGGAIYVVSAALLLLAAFRYAKRDAPRQMRA